MPPAAEPVTGVPPRTVFASIIAFWLLYFMIATGRAAVLGFAHPIDLLGLRAIVTLTCMAVTWALWRLLRRHTARGLAAGIAAAALLSVPAAIVYASVNSRMFRAAAPDADAAAVQVGDGGGATAPPAMIALLADTAINGYFFFVAWCALFLAMSNAAEGRAAERRAARFRSAAQAAELRALRYQVNPHFLFNTLNSLSSLVMTDKRDEAERMILNLSTFFRSSLAGDPVADTPLADEIALQRLYLAIEAVRFPGRVRLVEAIEPGVARACVPGLILQPLVENAVKHGVARTRDAVTITLRAWEEDGMLALAVCDDAAPATADRRADDPGIGLRNVADRLSARFGDDARFDAGPVRDGRGYMATMVLPLVDGHG